MPAACALSRSMTSFMAMTRKPPVPQAGSRNLLAGLHVQHADRHALHVTGGEKLAPVAAQVVPTSSS